MDASAAQYNMEAMNELKGMGFSDAKVKKALSQAGNNFENALNLLLSMGDDTGYDDTPKEVNRLQNLTPFAQEMQIPIESLKLGLKKFPHLSDNQLLDELMTNAHQYYVETDDKAKNYGLKAGVVHLGRQVNVGHYVAYGQRKLDEPEEEWVYFNDDSVCKVLETKIGCSYMLFFERI